MNVNSRKTPVKMAQISINVEKTGARIKAITQEQGYEVRDLMVLTGYSSQAIYKWFNGRSLPSTDTLVVLSKLLNTEISDLLVIDGEFDFWGPDATDSSMTDRRNGCNITTQDEHREENNGGDTMNEARQLNTLLKNLNDIAQDSPDGMKSEGRKIHDLLLSLARNGGAEECDILELRRAVWINMRYRLIYRDPDEWLEKRTELIDAIIDAVNEHRDSKIWMRTLVNCLRKNDVKDIVDRLSLAHVGEYLWPALEEEVDLEPTDDLMAWYVAVLDRSSVFDAEAFNRLAFFYLWYGEYYVDVEKARNYFLAMERRGIAPKNPYPGCHGEHSFDEMIQALLDGDFEEKLPQILEKLLEKPIAYVMEHGVREPIDDLTSEKILAELREDAYLRDLRECMRHAYLIASETHGVPGKGMMGNLLRYYGRELKRLIQVAKAAPERPELSRGVTLMLSMLDDWLECRMPEIIGLEWDAGHLSKEQFFKSLEDWLKDIEPFVGGDYRLGGEMVVLNALYNNLIKYHEERGDEEAVTDLLERLVYSTDTMAALSAMHVEDGDELYGRPYCTNNAINLLKRWIDANETTKINRLIWDIHETMDDITEEDAYYYYNLHFHERIMEMEGRFQELVGELFFE